MFYEQVHSAPDVFHIKVPFKNHKLDSTNCYVVRDGGDTLIVDTGAPSEKSRAYLIEALEQLAVDPAEAGFFLTHLHMDHAGLIDPIAPPDSPIYLNDHDYLQAHPENPELRFSELEEALIREGVSPEEADELISRRRSRAGIFTGDHKLVFTKDGDEISVGSYTFTVLDTAGHTPGHQALYEPSSGILFSGDHILFTLSPGVGLFLPEGDSVQAYLDNLRKVHDLGLKKLFHSHGEIRDDFEERIAWLDAHNRERAEQVRTIVEQDPGATGFEVTKQMEFNIPFDCWDDVPRVQRLSLLEIGSSFLRHLAATGAIQVREYESGVRHYFPNA